MNHKTFISFIILFFLVACGVEERKEYYSNGVLKSVTAFSKNGMDGKYMSFYENGNQKEERVYREGVPSGTWKLWQKNGQLREEKTYRNSMQDFERKEWNGEGKLVLEEIYKNGFKGIYLVIFNKFIANIYYMLKRR